jgi:hypothetical protein
MAANSSLNLSSLDFDTLKGNFKEFLKTQSVLKDYNFDGSNMSVLLDVMAYNSYLNSFYLNMVASEMFLDSAQKYDSVVSHAKELNYLPRSSHSSVANVSFTVETSGIEGGFTVPKGTRFFGTNSKGTFSFVTNEINTYTSSNSVYAVDNLQIYEGSYFRDSFVVDNDIEDQKFVLSNQNIDVNSVSVQVIENNDFVNPLDFTFSETLFGLNNTSKVFFLQGSESNKYEVVFGDGFFGRKPKNNSTIYVDYIVTNGSDGNEVESFTLTDDLGPVNGGIADSSAVITVSASGSGANQESLSSVKFSAPRYFATQQRAVTSDDYAALVLNNFGGEISDVTVYGGQEVEPKLYGRVILCLKPVIGTITPEYLKNRISNFLLEYISLPNRIVISDPEYIYIKLDTIVQHDIYSSNKSFSEIKNVVLNTILEHSSESLEKFNNDLRYSQITTDIDNSETTIISNQTHIRFIKRINPLFNRDTSYKFETGNPLFYETPTIDVGVPHAELYLNNYETHYEHASLISSKFVYNYGGKLYESSYFADDGQGNIKVYTFGSNKSIIPLTIVGTINYDVGSFELNNILINYYANYISIYLNNKDSDVYAKLNNIIIIDPTDVDIKVIEAKR